MSRRRPGFLNDIDEYPRVGGILVRSEQDSPDLGANSRSVEAEFPRPRRARSEHNTPPHGGIANTPHTGVLKQMRKHTRIIPPTSVRLVEAKFPRHRRAWPDQTHRGRGNSLKREFPRTRRNSPKHAYPPYGGIHVRLPQQGSLFKRDFMTD